MSFGRWPEDRADKWDVTDELRAHGIESIKTIINSAEIYETKQQPIGDEAIETETPKESQAVQIYKLISGIAFFFRDTTNTAYAHITVDDHDELLRLESARFQGIVRRRFFEDTGKIASSEALNAAISLVAADACWKGETFKLYNRVGWRDGNLYYDMTDSAWRAIEVDGERWRLLDRPPILFVRQGHQAPQVVPKAGGDIKRLFDFISIGSDDDKLLLLVWLVASFIPDFPHPIPILHGPQGSGKSTTFRRLRLLIDPSSVLTLTFPREISELVQQLSHNWAALFDNVTDLPNWLSDALCRAVTGEGFTKRKLFSDDIDFIYQFQRIIGLNGINAVATKPDLLDRAILIEQERISPDRRRTEEELDAEFKVAIPEILGGIFDALVKAIRIRPTVKLGRVPRMADFAHWGYAIAEALGYEGRQFLVAYSASIGAQNEEVLAGDAVASAIVDFMEKRTTWAGTATELLTELESVAEKLKLDTRARTWPKAPHILTRRVAAVKSNLEDAGIDFDREHSGNRTITLTRQQGTQSSVQSVQASTDVKKQGLTSGRYLDATERLDATENELDATEKSSVQLQDVENERVEKEKDESGRLDATSGNSIGVEQVEEWV